MAINIGSLAWVSMFSGLQAWAYKNTYATSVSYRQEALTVHKPLQLVYRLGLTAVHVPYCLGYRCESPIGYIAWRQGYHHKLSQYMHHGGFVIGVIGTTSVHAWVLCYRHEFPTAIPDDCWFTGNDLQIYSKCTKNAESMTWFSRLICEYYQHKFGSCFQSVVHYNSHSDSCFVRRMLSCSMLWRC